MTTPVEPRLIRPTKDGHEGEWSYLFQAAGHDYIFPAQVREMGKLHSLLSPPSDSRKWAEPSDPAWETKVIYWKASDWEAKLLPQAVAWVKAHGFTFPNVPFNRMEFRKIEDRDGEDRVAEVVNVIALPPDHNRPTPELMVFQFKAIADEEGNGRKPLMQWWMEGTIEFHDSDAKGHCISLPNVCDRLERWSDLPEFIKKNVVERYGPADALKVLASRDQKGPRITDDEMRVAVMWLAFCRYITSLKIKYEEGLPTRDRKRSEARTTEEALALEQSEIFKTVGVLKSGVRKKPVATGTGTAHRYRYLVRGHERIVNGKSIWVKPQVRGQGEFLARSIGTDEAIESAKEIEPHTPVTVTVPVEPGLKEAADAHFEEHIDQVTDADGNPPDEVMQELGLERESTPPIAVVQPQPFPEPARHRSIVRTVLSFFRSLFR